VHITKKTLAALLAAVAVISAVVSGGMALLFRGSSTPIASAPVTVTAAPAPAPATNTPPTTQPKAVQAADNTPAAELVPGSKGYGSGATYTCKQGTTPLQVVTGKTAQKDGTTLSLKEDLSSLNSTDQFSVSLHVQLDKAAVAPTLIINTAAHNQAPESYAQRLFEVWLQPGTSGDYRFLTLSYADNYTSEGITDITACIRPVQ
jgi:hypothetical protein